MEKLKIIMQYQKLDNYLKFLKKNKLYIKKTNKFYNKDLTSNFYLTKETNLNYFKLKKIIKNKINKEKFKIIKNSIFKRSYLKDFDKVVICCYSNNNYILKELGIKKIPKLRYELIEKILIKLPKYYKNKSFIVLDGNFVCLDPYLGTGYHLLSDVKHSKIEVIRSKFPKFKNKKKRYLNKGLIYNKKKN